MVLFLSLGLPARLGHSGDIALVRGLAQADPAEAELTVIATRASTTRAGVVSPRFELGLTALLHLHRSLSHLISLSRPLLRPLRRVASGWAPRPQPARTRSPPRRQDPPAVAPRAWRRRRGSPLSVAQAPPARPRPAGGPPLCGAPPPPRPPPRRRGCPAGPLWQTACRARPVAR